MRPLADALLYGIIDLGYVRDENAPGVLQQLIEGGIDMVQLRGKSRTIDELSVLAEKLLQLSIPANIPLVINDHAEVARRVEVQGVHVGQDDDAIEQVRAKAERPILVGKSTHSLEQAITARREGADYIGFGPIFSTPTKPDYEPIGMADIRTVENCVALPVFCIGGIKVENLPQVIAAGAKRAVIVSGLLKSVDPSAYARRVKRLLAAANHQQSDIRKR